jgi:hypothetical protein
VLYEYYKCLRDKKSPLLVLRYTGEVIGGGRQEVVFGLGEMEREVQVAIRFDLPRRERLRDVNGRGRGNWIVNGTPN